MTNKRTHQAIGPREAEGEQLRAERRLTVWVVSELYYPEDNTTGVIMTSIAEGLATNFKVRVLTGQPVYSARGTRGLPSELRNGVLVKRCRSTTLDKDKLLLRVVNWLTLSCSILHNAIRLFRPEDIVIVVTQPPSLPFVATLACKIKRTRSVLLLHDIYPEALVAAGMVKSGGWIDRLLSKATVALYKRMDRIITLGIDMTELVATKWPEGRARTVQIPNWADTDLVTPHNKSENVLLAELGLEKNFVVLWAGNIGRPHGIEDVVEAARTLDGSDVHFLFIGSGAKRQWLQQAAERLNLSNMTILPARPRTDASNFLNACDVALVSLVPGMAGAAVPSRLYQTLAAGKPIIAAVEESTEVACVLRDEDAGWVVPPGDPAAIITAIAQARSDSQTLGRKASNGWNAAQTKYSYPRVRQQYIDLVATLIEEQDR